MNDTIDLQQTVLDCTFIIEACQERLGQSGNETLTHLIAVYDHEYAMVPDSPQEGQKVHLTRNPLTASWMTEPLAKTLASRILGPDQTPLGRAIYWQDAMNRSILRLAAVKKLCRNLMVDAEEDNL